MQTDFKAHKFWLNDYQALGNPQGQSNMETNLEKHKHFTVQKRGSGVPPTSSERFQSGMTATRLNPVEMLSSKISIR